MKTPEIITIRASDPIKEKKEFKPIGKIEVLTKIPLREGYIRAIVIHEFQGMNDYLIEGDIVDLPERRFKSLTFRGMVEKYNGVASPNKDR